MKNNKKMIVILSGILLVLILIVVLLSTKNNGKSDAESTVEQQIQEEEAYIIETKYCDLYYPEKWKDAVKTEIIEEEQYVVEFYGSIEGENEQPLFKVIFGATDDVLGVLDVDGEEVEIGIEFMDPAIDDSWTEDDANTIYAMQEDVNYLIGMMKKEVGFKTTE